MVGLVGYFVAVRPLKNAQASLSNQKTAEIAVLEDDSKEAQERIARNNDRFDRLEEEIKSGLPKDPNAVKFIVENMTSAEVDAELKKRGLL